jgi:hypothetical protein
VHQRERFLAVKKPGAQKRRGGREGVVLKGEVGKIRLGDKKSGSTSHDPWCNRRRKRRPISRNLKLSCTLFCDEVLPLGSRN